MFCPFTDYWYVQAYAVLLCFLPVLNRLLAKMKTHPRLFRLVFLLLTAIILINTCCFDKDIFHFQSGYNFIWLAFLYLAGGMIRLIHDAVPQPRPRSTWKNVLIFGTLYFLVVILDWKLFKKTDGAEMFINYVSPLIIASGIFLFLALLALPVPEWLRKTARVLSPFAFGVYLMHENHIFRYRFIFDHLRWLQEQDVVTALILAVGIALCCFSLGIASDAIRNYLYAITGLERMKDAAAGRLDAFFCGLWDSVRR